MEKEEFYRDRAQIREKEGTDMDILKQFCQTDTVEPDGRVWTMDHEHKYYSNIHSTVIHGCTWTIYHDKKLCPEDAHFIASFDPAIFHNELECYLWAFDEKLPSGAWLEHIRFDNDLRSCTAFVYNG
jgi:hypothetical protein